MTDPASPSRQEQVLAQALTALAGGRSGPPASTRSSSPVAPGRVPLSLTHLLLVAAIIGIVIGAAGGLAVRIW